MHEIKDWDDFKNRLDSDRRCFAFFHPRIPDEPLIFVEVALVNGMAGNVQNLLDEAAPVLDPRAADTAILYSISSAQQGLDGISFVSFLIKRVADTLAAEYPKLKTFATPSPVSGFRAWLEGVLGAGEPKLLTTAERKALKAASLPDGSLGRARFRSGQPGCRLKPPFHRSRTEPHERRYLHRRHREHRAVPRNDPH